MICADVVSFKLICINALLEAQATLGAIGFTNEVFSYRQSSGIVNLAVKRGYGFVILT